MAVRYVQSARTQTRNPETPTSTALTPLRHHRIHLISLSTRSDQIS
jgi:hypothetical protein